MTKDVAKNWQHWMHLSFDLLRSLLSFLFVYLFNLDLKLCPKSKYKPELENDNRYYKNRQKDEIFLIETFRKPKSFSQKPKLSTL